MTISLIDSIVVVETAVQGTSGHVMSTRRPWECDTLHIGINNCFFYCLHLEGIYIFLLLFIKIAVDFIKSKTLISKKKGRGNL